MQDHGNTLLVTTPNALADELAKALRAQGRAYKVFAIGPYPEGTHPPGSVTVTTSSYRSFLRFVDNSDIGDIVFAASLYASPQLWLEALLDWRILGPLLRLEHRPSTTHLLEAICEDLSSRNVGITHPHYIGGDAFRLTGADQFDAGRADLTNRIRLDKLKRMRESAITLRESRILGITHDDELEEIAVEWLNTSWLLRCLGWKDLSRFQRVILYKTGGDRTLISYPVIGTTTLRDCRRYGVTDILLDVDGVVQGKQEVIRMAREAGISIRTI